jgi:hypothetical protein
LVQPSRKSCHWTRFAARNGRTYDKDPEKLKAFQDRKKCHADKNIFFRYFKEGEHVFLKVKPKISSIRLSFFPKLAIRYCVPFKIIKKKPSCKHARILCIHESA